MNEFDDLTDDTDDMPSAPFWMTTFSDMATLLLTFFVLIVSMSEVEIKKFEEALSFFRGHTGVLTESAVVPPTPAGEQAVRYEVLLSYLAENDLQDLVQVNMTEEGLHVVITDSVMFRSGEAYLVEPSRTILRMISDVVAGNVASVVVEGHTDDRPINTSAFPSNWELSGARASSVVRFFLQQENALDPDDYVAIGYGEHQPKTTNDTSAGRAKNRRVEILFSWQPWQNHLNPSTKSLPIQTSL